MKRGVCVVSSLYHPTLGGLGRQAVQLSESLARRGVRIHVLTRRMAGLPAYEFEPQVEVERISGPFESTWNLEEKSLRNLVISLSFSLRASYRLWRLRAEYEFVHFHGASLPLFVCLPVLKLLRKKVVAKVAASGLGTELGALRGRYFGIGSVLAAIGRRSDRLIATTEEIGRGLLSDGVDSSRIRHLPNFVDRTIFHPLSEEDRVAERGRMGFDGRRIVLFSGRLVRRKGWGTLLAAWSRSRVAGAGRTLLLVAGDGPDRRAMERRLAELGLGASAQLIGRVDDIHRLLQVVDLFVLPSLEEGMPNALLEALACGVPSIASDIGGVRAIVGDTDSLRLFPRGSAEGLADAIDDVLEDRDLSEHLRRAGPDRIGDGFSLERRSDEYLALLRELGLRVDSEVAQR